MLKNPVPGFAALSTPPLKCSAPVAFANLPVPPVIVATPSKLTTPCASGRKEAPPPRLFVCHGRRRCREVDGLFGADAHVADARQPGRTGPGSGHDRGIVGRQN